MATVKGINAPYIYLFKYLLARHHTSDRNLVNQPFSSAKWLIFCLKEYPNWDVFS